PHSTTHTTPDTHTLSLHDALPISRNSGDRIATTAGRSCGFGRQFRKNQERARLEAAIRGFREHRSQRVGLAERASRRLRREKIEIGRASCRERVRNKRGVGGLQEE